jgi:GT2 family glycosyltransferase
MVDDDVVVDSGWLLGHWNAHRETEFDAIQGRVLPGFDPEGRPADPARLREYNIPVVDYGDAVREIRGLTGTNVSIKRRVVERVGFFDERLGPGASGFSEDTEYSRRIRKAGFRIGYTPRAIVYHELDPARYGREYHRAVQYRKGLSRSLYRSDSILFDVLPNLLASCARLALYRLCGSEQKAYRAEGRMMRYRGYLAGRLKRRPPS